MKKRTCKKCLMTSNIPYCDINKENICVYCREFSIDKLRSAEEKRKIFENRFNETIKKIKDSNMDASYDCLVPLSGGKDSCYLTNLLIEKYNLRVLSYTFDVGLSSTAWDSIERTVKNLDLDHLIFRPPEKTFKKIVRFLLMNQLSGGAVRTVDYEYAYLFESQALYLASEKNINYIFAGYSPGQPEPERMLYEFNRKLICETNWTPKFLEDSKEFSKEELSLWWNPEKFSKDKVFPHYIAPLHALPYSQDEVMKEVVSKGLVKNMKNANPVFSNFPLNWLLMYSDLKNLGYNPYTPEFSKLIREGKASRRTWAFFKILVELMITYRVFLGKNVTKCLKWLNLKPSDLKITRKMKSSKNSPYPGKLENE